MAQYHSEDLLILTKTYPSPSGKYIETTCIAAVNSHGQLRRLFPVPFRLLNDPQQFRRWDWIRARITHSSDDHRPESHKIDYDSIQIVGHIPTHQTWDERMQWVTPHLQPSFATLEQRRITTGETLGFITPTSFRLVIKKATSTDWTPEEKIKLTRTMLFDSPEVLNRPLLEKIPFDFYYVYQIPNDIERTHKITDWEAASLFRNTYQQHGPNWETPFKQRLESDFSALQLTFLMGTMHIFPHQWLIVGLVYPPKAPARQVSLFPLSPND